MTGDEAGQRARRSREGASEAMRFRLPGAPKTRRPSRAAWRPGARPDKLMAPSRARLESPARAREGAQRQQEKPGEKPVRGSRRLPGPATPGSDIRVDPPEHLTEDPAGAEGGSRCPPQSGGSRPNPYTPRINDNASARAAASPSKHPRTAEVTVEAPGFRTPRIVMHMCSACITTITPCGSSFSIRRSAT